MQLDFLKNLLNISPTDDRVSQSGVQIGQTKLPLDFVRNKRAKRYIVRLLPEFTLRVTIPRGGSRREALRFVSENIQWIEKQVHSLRLQDALNGTTSSSEVTVFYQGRLIPIDSIDTNSSCLMLKDGSITNSTLPNESPKGVADQYLHWLAKNTLPEITKHLAKRYGFSPARISIRNQKTRWGSCSNSGTISLNWRLVQVPAYVRDYVILHELAHLEYLDHSPKFWDRLAKLCPNHRSAESWLKTNSHRVR